MIWAWRTRTAPPENPEYPTHEKNPSAGPHGWIQHPEEAACALFYLCLACVAANWLAILSCVIAAVVQFLVLAISTPAIRSRVLGDGSGARVVMGGILSPEVVPIADRQYTVPKRFGMAAIVALLTTFGILFGTLKYWEAHPVVYLFVASEIVAVCLAQILFGAAPRGGSVLTGAILLPFWAALTTEQPLWMPTHIYVLCCVFLFAFGGLLGYCIGAMAAGFFLVMDLVDPMLPGGASSSTATGSVMDMNNTESLPNRHSATRLTKNGKS
jgi:hypothetical protein